MPGVVLVVIVALIVSGYLKRRKKKEQAGRYGWAWTMTQRPIWKPRCSNC